MNAGLFEARGRRQVPDRVLLHPHRRRQSDVHQRPGHNPPIVIGKERHSPPRNRRPRPHGLFEGASFDEETISLEKDDLVLVYSDGVTEAVNVAGDEFGDDRLIEELQKRQGQPLDEMLEQLLAVVKDFAGAAPQNDDITMMLLRYDSPARQLARAQPEQDALLRGAKPQRNGSSGPALAAHGDRAPDQFDVALGDRETESGPRRLGREVRLEQPAHGFLIHSDPCIAHLQHHGPLGLRCVVPRGDGERPATWHRVQRVFNEVRQRAREQCAIDEHGQARCCARPRYAHATPTRRDTVPRRRR